MLITKISYPEFLKAREYFIANIAVIERPKLIGQICFYLNCDGVFKAINFTKTRISNTERSSEPTYKYKLLNRVLLK